jgi:iron complex outermembrane receptor protein
VGPPLAHAFVSPISHKFRLFRFLFFCLLGLMPMQLLFAQTILSGTVSTSGQPLQNATVAVRNIPQFNTRTDQEGKFLISLPFDSNVTIIVSYLGYETYTTSLTGPGPWKGLAINLEQQTALTASVLVQASRVNLTRSPAALTEVSKKQIEAVNLGQDLPILLNQQPAVVTSSDAGNGFGYTSIRIRGSDPTRINFTLNGLPLNEPDNHGVYWVDLPDFASSISNLQIVRGIGSSTGSSR